MRPVRLTSPPMHGPDIRHLQGVLNDRLHHYRSKHRLQVDGVLGPTTMHALNGVGYIMGMEAPYGRVGVLQRVLHPALLSPIERNRGRQREAARRAHKTPVGPGGAGLAHLPEVARRYVGVHEHPPGSNWGWPYPAQWLRDFGLGPASWCGAFAGAMVRLAGGHVDERVCYVPNIEAMGRSRTGGFDRFVPNHTEGVGPGWLALFNWNGGSEPEHVEIVKEVHPGYLVCVGGNTGGANPGWGGMVGLEYRSYPLTVGYARPRL